ncbi:MAG: hypothetical protein QME57_00905 [Patescibacteria group bacterium]|nr:hypothetical protein [Patescibacteria group bacterium]
MFQSDHRGFTPLEIQKSLFLFKGSKVKSPNRLALFTIKLNGKFLTGFTFIEVMIAIFVLTIGVLGVFTAIQNITFSSQINFSKLTATYLVQEGIELVRNQRDSNWLAGDPWDSNLPSGTETGLLGKFSRTITITEPSSDKKVVSVKVSWQERGKNYSITAETELYNWYEK